MQHALNYLQEKLTDGLAINYSLDNDVVGLVDAFFDEEKEIADEEKEIADENIASLEEKRSSS